MQQIRLNPLRSVGIHRHSKGIIALELNLEHRTAWSLTQGPLGRKKGCELMCVCISSIFSTWSLHSLRKKSFLKRQQTT